MRPIKFRAWSKQDKKMVYAEMHEYDKSVWTGTDDRVPIMQFTGLHDQHGKEIWEGDVVKYYDSTAMWLTSDVRWVGSTWAITTSENPIPLYEFVNRYVYNGDPIKEIEILGNVWEHPHLLTEGTG